MDLANFFFFLFSDHPNKKQKLIQMERTGSQTPKQNQGGQGNYGNTHPTGWEIKVEVRPVHDGQTDRSNASGTSVTFIQPNK